MSESIADYEERILSLKARVEYLDNALGIAIQAGAPKEYHLDKQIEWMRDTIISTKEK